jgi:hypothetical protein
VTVAHLALRIRTTGGVIGQKMLGSHWTTAYVTPNKVKIVNKMSEAAHVIDPKPTNG